MLDYFWIGQKFCCKGICRSLSAARSRLRFASKSQRLRVVFWARPINVVTQQPVHFVCSFSCIKLTNTTSATMNFFSTIADVYVMRFLFRFTLEVTC